MTTNPRSLPIDDYQRLLTFVRIDKISVPKAAKILGISTNQAYKIVNLFKGQPAPPGQTSLGSKREPYYNHEWEYRTQCNPLASVKLSDVLKEFDPDKYEEDLIRMLKVEL